MLGLQAVPALLQARRPVSVDCVMLSSIIVLEGWMDNGYSK